MTHHDALFPIATSGSGSRAAPRGLIIAIDGPAAAGKSSVAKALSKKFNLLYLDSGALYRAMAWETLQKGINIQNEQEVVAFCQTLSISIRNGNQERFEVWVDSENVTPFLRATEVTRASSVLSAYRGVREKILILQREIGQRGVVAEGRDMGTVVFPHADLKLYLDASLLIRGERRYKELQSKGVSCNLEQMIADIQERDQRDQEREISPLQVANDAIRIDSTVLSLDDVIFIIEKAIKERYDHI